MNWLVSIGFCRQPKEESRLRNQSVRIYPDWFQSPPPSELNPNNTDELACDTSTARSTEFDCCNQPDAHKWPLLRCDYGHDEQHDEQHDGWR